METEKKLAEKLGFQLDIYKESGCEIFDVLTNDGECYGALNERQTMALWRECLRLMAEQEWVKGIVRDLIGAENPQELARGLNELAPDAGLGKPARKYPLTTTDVAIMRAADFLAGRPITLPDQGEK